MNTTVNTTEVWEMGIETISLYCASALFGNIAFSAMGFGMGICFLFVYQIGVLAGVMGNCGLKHAVFIQNIAILVVQPLVLWKAGLKKNLRLDMMLTMVPMQLIGTPVGQFLQDHVPSAILKIIVGVITIAVALWQIYNIWKATRTSSTEIPPKDGYEMVETKTDQGVHHQEKQSWVTRIKVVFCPLERAIVGMLFFAFLSGFTGGLIGVRGPPLIIFFFLWEYPKAQTRANGTVIATVNTLVRIITYMLKGTPAEYPHDTWFVREDLYLYLAVAGTSIIAAPIGIFLTRYLNKSGYKIALTMLLIINGITMITTASLDIENRGLWAQ